MNRHAEMFRSNGVGVGHQFQPTGNPAQAAVDPRQHRLEITQQDGGQIAHCQPRFQHVFGHQTQRAGAHVAGQYYVGRQRRPEHQRLPAVFQLLAELTGNLFALAAQFAHAIEKQQLRRASGFGTVEQHIVEMRDCSSKHLRECGHEHVMRLFEQALVAARCPDGLG